MTRTFLVIALVFSYLGVFGQNYRDTVFIKYVDEEHYIIDTVVTDTTISLPVLGRYILIGTTVLPRRGDAYFDYGLDLLNVTKSNCQNYDKESGLTVYDMEDHINSILLTDSTLTIDFNIIANCCHNFLCDFEVDTNGILQLILIYYGDNCACHCCFGLTFHLKFWEDKYNICERKKIKAVMIGNNRKTLKEITK